MSSSSVALYRPSYAVKRKRSYKSSRKTNRRIRGRVPSLSEVVHKFQRTVISAGGSGDTGININSQIATGFFSSGSYDFGFTFSLAGVFLYLGGVYTASWAMNSTSEFTALFDMYRIASIDVVMTMNVDNSPNGAPTISMPIIYMVEDFDDSSDVPLTSIVQYNNLKTIQCGVNDKGSVNRFRIHPKPAETVWYTSVTSGYQQGTNKKWMNTNYNAVPYFGLKGVIDPIHTTAGSVSLGYLHFSFTYNLEFKGPK